MHSGSEMAIKDMEQAQLLFCDIRDTQKPTSTLQNPASFLEHNHNHNGGRNRQSGSMADRP
jgi:hypothetical protein